MIKLTIDGKNIETEESLTILQVARRNDIDIPTLCYHEAVESSGACRLCTVEITVRKRRRFVTACNYVVSDGMVVKTASPEVKEIQKTILELLLARCPDVKIIKDLANSYGIKKSRFELENQTCTLCGLCVSVCQEIIGAGAISLVSRGVDARVDTPFHLSSEACIGCGACAAVCPTGAIQLKYTQDSVAIKPFNTIVKLTRCVSCSRELGPEPQVSSVGNKLAGLAEAALLCNDCKRERTSLALANNARFPKNSYLPHSL